MKTKEPSGYRVAIKVVTALVVMILLFWGWVFVHFHYSTPAGAFTQPDPAAPTAGQPE